jgi:hypothetical protein
MERLNLWEVNEFSSSMQLASNLVASLEEAKLPEDQPVLVEPEVLWKLCTTYIQLYEKLLKAELTPSRNLVKINTNLH